MQFLPRESSTVRTRNYVSTFCQSTAIHHSPLSKANSPGQPLQLHNKCELHYSTCYQVDPNCTECYDAAERV